MEKTKGKAVASVLNPCFERREGRSIYLRSNPKADFFRKFEESSVDNASLYYHVVESDFSLSARVTIHPRSTYDAVFLMARTSETQWLKLAFERAPDGGNAIVSVFSNPWSDDANGELVEGETAWLRLSRVGNHWGLHYSLNGKAWRFVRTLGFAPQGPLYVGYGVQSPSGEGFDAELHDLQCSICPVTDFRSGQ